MLPGLLPMLGPLALAVPVLTVAITPSPRPPASDDLRCSDNFVEAPMLRPTFVALRDGTADLASAIAKGDLAAIQGKWQTSLFQGMWYSQYCFGADGRGTYHGYDAQSGEMCIGDVTAALDGDAVTIHEADGPCRNLTSTWTGMVVTCRPATAGVACQLWDDKGSDEIGLSRVP